MVYYWFYCFNNIIVFIYKSIYLHVIPMLFPQISIMALVSYPLWWCCTGPQGRNRELELKHGRICILERMVGGKWGRFSEKKIAHFKEKRSGLAKSWWNMSNWVFSALNIINKGIRLMRFGGYRRLDYSFTARYMEWRCRFSRPLQWKAWNFAEVRFELGALINLDNKISLWCMEFQCRIWRNDHIITCWISAEINFFTWDATCTCRSDHGWELTGTYDELGMPSLGTVATGQRLCRWSWLNYNHVTMMSLEIIWG